MNTNSFRSFLLALAATIALQAAAQALYNSGSSTNTDLGPVTTLEINQSALLYQQTARYTFSTSRTGDASSSIVVGFGTAGGNGYVIDLYRNDLRIGTTDAYTLTLNGGSWLTNLGETITYAGRNEYYTNGTGAAILPLTGLPVGSYRIIISRSALFGETTNYALKLRFPGSSGSTGGTGGTITGGGSGLRPVTLAELSNGLDFTDPVAGRAYNTMPTARVTIDTDGLTQVIEVLYRLDSSDRINGILDWEEEVVDAYSAGAEDRSAHQNNRWLDGDETSIRFYAPSKPLAPGTYVLVAVGKSGSTQVAEALTWFTIATTSTGGGTGGGGTTPSAAVAGSYSGIITPATSSGTWGQIDLKVSAQGCFTGKVQYLSTVTPLKGTLVDEQTLAFTSISGGQIQITPHFSQGAIDARYVSASHESTGRLAANRFHARNNPAPIAGRAALDATSISNYSSSAYPAGAVRTSLRVSKAGRFAYVGRISGEPFSVAGVIQPDGDAFAFASFTRKNRDLLLGNEGTITRDAATGGLAATINVDWASNDDRRARQYPEGFWITVDFASAR